MAKKRYEVQWLETRTVKVSVFVNAKSRDEALNKAHECDIDEKDNEYYEESDAETEDRVAFKVKEIKE